MNKLNRKGFTLVELLAVIVILAIVVGITLVTILPTLSNAKVKAFETAVDTIKTFVREEYDKCMVGDTTLTGSLKVTFGENCAAPSPDTYSAVATAAGYSTSDLVITEIVISNGAVTVSAYAKNDGRFENATYNSTSVTYSSN